MKGLASQHFIERHYALLHTVLMIKRSSIKLSLLPWTERTILHMLVLWNLSGKWMLGAALNLDYCLRHQDLSLSKRAPASFTMSASANDQQWVGATRLAICFYHNSPNYTAQIHGVNHRY